MSALETGQGHVVAINPRYLGASLTSAASSGATVLVVDDCSDLDDVNGGTCNINGDNYTYSDVDDDASTVTVSPGLFSAAAVGDLLTMTDASNGLQQEWIAQVVIDGDDPGDALDASVVASLAPLLLAGVRPGSSESVGLFWDEDDVLWVNDVLGAPAAVQQAGDVVVSLSGSGPYTGSVDVVFNPPFVATPAIFLDDSTSVPADVSYSVQASSASPTGFTINVSRTDAATDTRIWWGAMPETQ